MSADRFKDFQAYDLTFCRFKADTLTAYTHIDIIYGKGKRRRIHISGIHCKRSGREDIKVSFDRIVKTGNTTTHFVQESNRSQRDFYHIAAHVEVHGIRIAVSAVLLNEREAKTTLKCIADFNITVNTDVPSRIVNRIYLKACSGSGFGKFGHGVIRKIDASLSLYPHKVSAVITFFLTITHFFQIQFQEIICFLAFSDTVQIIPLIIFLLQRRFRLVIVTIVTLCRLAPPW